MTDDAFAPAVSYIAIACTARDRWFDLDAVRHAPTKAPQRHLSRNTIRGTPDGARQDQTYETWDDNWTSEEVAYRCDPAGAPPLDWFTLPADELSLLLCKAMVPRRVCVVCGEPSRRIVERERNIGPLPEGPYDAATREGGHFASQTTGVGTTYMTLGWTDCGCRVPRIRDGETPSHGYALNRWRPGVAYDPFPRTETDMPARFIVGDALTELRKMPDNSVDLVMTSPPFLALRSYLPADHPDKQKEIGSERTPGEYLDVLLDVVVECRRVLAPHGSLVFELGDTYAGGGDEMGMRITRQGNARPKSTGNQLPKIDRSRGWPLDKSLTGIPELFMLSLTYGRNLLTGRELEPWRVRNYCPWVRPNPPVGALGDKFRPATSYLTVACTSRDRWFDLDAVRTENPRLDEPGFGTGPKHDGHPKEGGRSPQNPAGAPPLDWFNIPTAPYKGAHYATYPPALVTPFVKAMCPGRVCRVCGEPSRRIVKQTDEYQAFRDQQNADYAAGQNEKLGSRAHAASQTTPTGMAVGGWNNIDHQITGAEYETVGWTDCECCPSHEDPCTIGCDGSCECGDKWRPGVVLDPFVGSGTTLAVATGHGRDAIGIDLDPRNAELAQQRCGMFLEVEDHEAAPMSDDTSRINNPRFRTGYVRQAPDGTPLQGPAPKPYGAP